MNMPESLFDFLSTRENLQKALEIKSAVGEFRETVPSRFFSQVKKALSERISATDESWTVDERSPNYPEEVGVGLRPKRELEKLSDRVWIGFAANNEQDISGGWIGLYLTDWKNITNEQNPFRDELKNGLGIETESEEEGWAAFTRNSNNPSWPDIITEEINILKLVGSTGEGYAKKIAEQVLRWANVLHLVLQREQNTILGPAK